MDNLRQSMNGLGGTISGFAVLVFLLLGISGTLYKLLAPDGWIVQAFGHGMGSGHGVLLALGIVGALGWFAHEYHSPRPHSRFSNFFVYGFTCAGLVYAARFWMTGVF